GETMIHNSLIMRTIASLGGKMKLMDIRPGDEEAERFVMQSLLDEDHSARDDVTPMNDHYPGSGMNDRALSGTRERCGKVIPFYYLGYRIFRDDPFTEKDDPGMVSSSFAIIMKPGPL
ncbi:MAG: hypothetical protein KBA61_13635, partial [Spirochaetes bacterium]|nr:hypothetical protein [Spirochaetota bacterium]